MSNFNLQLTYLEHLTLKCYPATSLSLSRVMRKQAQWKKERTNPASYS